MNTAKKVDFVMTILMCIVALMCIWGAFLCFGGGDMLFGATKDVMDHDVDPNSVTAGYEVLGMFALGMGGLLGGIMALLLGVWFGFFGVVLTIACILAFVRIKKYNAFGNAKLIKKNLTTKMILNTILLVFLVFLLVSEFAFGMLVVVVIAGAFEYMYIRLIKQVSIETL